MQPYLSIAVPCYNEALNIPFIAQKFEGILAAHSNVEVLLVNNGSTDNSAAVFEAELAKQSSKNIRVVNVPVNKGYGFGILSGLAEAKGELLAWTHADLQTDPADVIEALNVYEKAVVKPILVKGYRRNRRISEAFFSWCMGVVSSFALRTRLTEINAQPKLFSKAFYESIKADAPHDFSLDLYFLFKARQKGRIMEIPVYFLPRQYGEAKGGSGSSFKTRYKLIKRTFKYIFELKNKLQ